MSRLRTLRLILLLALPYLILAVGAEFMHHHDGGDCSACAWAGSGICHAYIAPVAQSSVMISSPFLPQYFFESADLHTSASPRAPPA